MEGRFGGAQTIRKEVTPLNDFHGVVQTVAVFTEFEEPHQSPMRETFDDAKLSLEEQSVLCAGAVDSFLRELLGPFAIIDPMNSAHSPTAELSEDFVSRGRKVQSHEVLIDQEMGERKLISNKLNCIPM